MREKLNTLVRPQTADSTEHKEECNQLRNRWENMVKAETRLLEKICRMDIEEINDAYYKDWVDHTDEFNDIIYSLRARAFLVKTIHEILWQGIN